MSPLARTLLALAVIAPLATAAAQDDALAAREAEARDAVADEVARVVTVAVAKHAYALARAEIALGLGLDPASPKLSELGSMLEGLKDDPEEGSAPTLEAEAKKAREKIADLLGDLAVACEQGGARARFEHWLDVIRARLPAESGRALARAGAAWFEPYGKWVKASEAGKLEAGGEQVDGKWLERDEVLALDREHASWKSPWVLADEVHEVRTTLPLRSARQLLFQVGAYREQLLRQVRDGWDLRPPRGKLPVIVTATQEELRAQMELHGGAPAGAAMNGAAYYLQTNRPLNPCFATLEPVDATGARSQVGVDGLLLSLRHELTHQIAFEYSKHACDATRTTEYQSWCIEGIANYMMFWTLEKGSWRYARPRRIPEGKGFIVGDLGWCRDNVARLPSLPAFFALGREAFPTVEHYHVATGVAAFFLEGEGGKYRGRFLKLLETVHRVHDGAKTFETCFPGVDPKALQAEFLRFVAKIELDE
jgi:hypothetical protein